MYFLPIKYSVFGLINHLFNKQFNKLVFLFVLRKVDMYCFSDLIFAAQDIVRSHERMLFF